MSPAKPIFIRGNYECCRCASSFPRSRPLPPRRNAILLWDQCIRGDPFDPGAQLTPAAYIRVRRAASQHAVELRQELNAASHEHEQPTCQHPLCPLYAHSQETGLAQPLGVMENRTASNIVAPYTTEIHIVRGN